MTLTLTGNFPGGAPRRNGAVRREGGAAFVVFPESESADMPAYKFRMDLTVDNPAPQPVSFDLRVDWKEPIYMRLRKTLYWRSRLSAAWQAAEAIERRGETSWLFRFEAPPEGMDISAQPRYGENRLSELSKAAAGCPDLSVYSLGETDAGRSVLAFDFSRRGKRQRQTLLVMARIHPYETAGSYCLDGVVRVLSSDDNLRERFLASSDLTLVPIAAPDGVAEGFCRLNGTDGGGIDLARAWKDDDPICRIVKGFADRRRLCGYMEIHNWMHPEVDGVKYTHYFETRCFTHRMRRLGAPNKPWRQFHRYGLLPSAYLGIKKWVHDHTGAKCLMVEYPWHGRTVEDMGVLGLKTIQAFQQICS